jgi:SAM-dependent methyltransferase
MGPAPVDKAYRGRFYAGYFSTHYSAGVQTNDAFFRRASYTLRRLLLPFLPADRSARILDAGCGVGYALTMLMSAGYRDVCGIDVSPDQVAVARTRGLPVQQADVFEFLQDRRGDYDAILALDLIEHLDRDELLRFLDLVVRALRPRGRLIVKTPNANSIIASRMRFKDMTHELIFSDSSLRQAFRTCGLNPVHIAGEPFYPVGVAGWVRWILAACIHGAWRLCLFAELGREGAHVPVAFNLIGVAERP